MKRLWRTRHRRNPVRSNFCNVAVIMPMSGRGDVHWCGSRISRHRSRGGFMGRQRVRCCSRRRFPPFHVMPLCLCIPVIRGDVAPERRLILPAEQCCIALRGKAEKENNQNRQYAHSATLDCGGLCSQESRQRVRRFNRTRTNVFLQARIRCLVKSRALATSCQSTVRSFRETGGRFRGDPHHWDESRRRRTLNLDVSVVRINRRAAPQWHVPLRQWPR